MGFLGLTRGSDNTEGGSGEIDRPPAASSACSRGVPVPFIFGVPDLFDVPFEFEVVDGQRSEG